MDRKFLPAMGYLTVAPLLAVFSCVLAIYFPEDGRVINPLIMLAIYLLPVVAAYFLLNGLYRLYVASKDQPSRNLGEMAVNWILLTWRNQDRRLREGHINGDNGRA